MPIAADTLKSDSVNATLRFVKDANEQVTHLVLTQNGASREAKNQISSESQSNTRFERSEALCLVVDHKTRAHYFVAWH